MDFKLNIITSTIQHPNKTYVTITNYTRFNEWLQPDGRWNVKQDKYYQIIKII